MTQSPRDPTPSVPDHAADTVPPEQGVWVGGPVGAQVRSAGYEILGELGRGGMGVVYKARHLTLNRVVALKMILAGGHADDAERERFKAEAEAVALLQHPNIVQIFEVGVCEGLPFFALEFCAGGGLDRKLAGTPLPPMEAAALVGTLARAVQAAHDKGVIHRDLKPANVLLAADGEPKITDFGLAKKLHEEGQTHTGAVMGTPSYMAPEQAGGKSKEVGPAADVYALGAILYEMLTGRPPFKAATPLDTMLQVVADEPVAPRQLQPKTPRDLDTICLKCLQKATAKRYATAAELAEDLRRFGAGEPVRARPVGAGERLGKWVRRRPAAAALWVVIAASALTAAVFAAVLYQRNADLENANAATKRERDHAKTNEALANKNAGLAETRRVEADAKAELAFRSAYEARMSQAPRTWEDAHIDQLTALLAGQTPEATGGKDLRGFEWYYWRNCCHAELLTFTGHSDAVRGAHYGSDGRRVFTGSNDGTVRVWDVETGRELRRLTLSGPASVMAVSPDGERVAAYVGVPFDDYQRGPAELGKLQVLDIASHSVVASCGGYVAPVACVAFSPDGKRLAGVGGAFSGSHEFGEGRIWDAATGRELLVLPRTKWPLFSAAFSPDGGRLAAVESNNQQFAGATHVWDAEGKEILTIPVGGSCVAFDAAGKRLVVGGPMAIVGGGGVKVFDATTGAAGVVPKGNGYVVCAAFSPDGARLATGGADQLVRVWNATTGEELLTLKGHTGGVLGLAFSPDGERIVSGSKDGSARLWDLAGTETSHLTLRSRSRPPRQVAFGSGGRRLVAWSWPQDPQGAGCTDEVRVWDARSGEQVQYIPVASARGVRAMDCSPDGARIAAACGDLLSPEGEFKIWQAETGKELRSVKEQNGGCYSVAFGPDGRRLAVGCGNQSVEIWNADSGEKVRSLTCRCRLVRQVIFSPDGKRLAAAIFGSRDGSVGYDGEVKIWDAETGEEVFTFRKAQAGGLAFSPDGHRLALALITEPDLKVWDVDAGREALAIDRVGPEMHETAVAFSPDGKRIAAMTDDDTTKLYDAATGAEMLVLRAPGRSHEGMCSLAFSPDGEKLAATSPDGSVWLWLAPKEKRPVRAAVPAPLREMQPLLTRGPSLPCTAVGPDGRTVLAGGFDHALHLWKGEDGKHPREFKGHTDVVWSVALSPDGKVALSGSQDKTVRFWKVETGAELHQFHTDGIISSVRFSPDGKIAAATCWDKKARFWEAATGKELHVFSYDFPILNIAFSPDGSRFLLGNTAGTPLLCDAETGRVLRKFEGHTDAVHNVAFSPDGKTALSAGHDGTLKLWNVESGECLRTYRGHVGQVHEVRFLPDGKRMVSCGDDRTVRLWDVETGNEIARGHTHLAGVRGLAVSTDGRFAVTAGFDGGLRRWEMPVVGAK